RVTGPSETGLPLPQFSWLAGVKPGPFNVSVEQPLSLVTGLLRTALICWPALPWNVRCTPWPTRLTFIGTAGPLMITVPTVIGADTQSVLVPVATVSTSTRTL